MPSRYYTALLLIGGSAALFGLGSLFGLGLLSAPPVAPHSTIADRPVKVDKKADDAERKADARLSPLYPTDPGLTEPQLRAAKQTAISAQAAPRQAKSAPPAQYETTGAPAADREANPLASASAQYLTHCAVRACAAAYRSFRASDCTYQPYKGPRQLCEKLPSPHQRQALKWRDRNSTSLDEDDDLNGAVEAVRRMTPGFESFDSEPPPPRRRVIVIDR